MHLPELVADVPDLDHHPLLLPAAVHILPLDQEPRGEDPRPVRVIGEVKSVLGARVLIEPRKTLNVVKSSK